MIVVLANGCFDLLHPGHVAHLQEARRMGDFLIVALTLDPYVGKGPQRPIFSWEDRALLLRELRCVDTVVPSATGADAILQWRPNIYCKGIDYTTFDFNDGVKEACAKTGTEMRFTEAPKMSSEETIRRVMQQSYKDRTMWNVTSDSLPPKGEVLAVVHKLSSRGEYAHEDATWDGEMWTRRIDSEKLEKSYYFQWRRLET